LAISHTASTISCTPMGSSRIVYVVSCRWLNQATKHAAIVRMMATRPQPDSHRE
jgi:hypothetical protein